MTWRRTLALVLAVTVLAGCGGDDGGTEPQATAEGGPPFSVEEVSAAFEAVAGVPFSEQASRVDDAVALSAGPLPVDSPELQAYNDALGESAVLFEVYVFEGEDPPLYTEAARATASSSSTFEDIGQGVYLGDFDTAYYANGNVVVRGPLLNGNPDDETLDAWRQVVDSL
jgi:hypothetical protein